MNKLAGYLYKLNENTKLISIIILILKFVFPFIEFAKFN